MTSSPLPPAGWHPDPQDPTGRLRWWDGERWTDHTHQAPSGSAAPPFGAGQQPFGAGQQPFGTGPGAQGGWNGPNTPYGYGQSGPPPFASPGSWPTGASRGSLWHQNSLSLTTLGVVALYLVLAVTTHFVIFGVLPVLLTIRAFNRRERLAPLAAVASAAAVIAAIVVLSSR